MKYYFLINFVIFSIRTVECSNSKLMVRRVDYRDSRFYHLNVTFKNLDDGEFSLDLAYSNEKAILKEIVSFDDFTFPYFIKLISKFKDENISETF